MYWDALNYSKARAVVPVLSGPSGLDAASLRKRDQQGKPPNECRPERLNKSVV
jgi:hypothetical protein